MTRKTTWTNSDGLIVGFGPNYSERSAGGDVKTGGGLREARVTVTWESTLTEGGAGFYLPLYATFHGAWFEVETAWASADAGTLAVGHTEADVADVDALFTTTALAAAALTPAGKKIAADGVLAVGDNADNRGNPTVLTDDFDNSAKGVKVFFTKTNNFTAGKGTLVVQYS
jgi:hypothetical protein